MLCYKSCLKIVENEAFILTKKSMLRSKHLILQISQDKYTLFCALNYFGLRACKKFSNFSIAENGKLCVAGTPANMGLILEHITS